MQSTTDNATPPDAHVPASAPQQGDPARTRATQLADQWPWLIVVGASLAIAYLSLTRFLIGPYTEADAKLMRAALVDQFDGGSYFSYVQVWSLHGLVNLVEDRRLAGALLGAGTFVAFVLANFGLARNALGTALALLSTGILLTFAPLLMHVSSPQPVTAATAYATVSLWVALSATGRTTRLWKPICCGLLCIAGMRAHICAAAVVPPVLVCLSRERPGRRRQLWLWAGGLLGGMLCIEAYTAFQLHDPLGGFRLRAFHDAGEFLQSGPWRTMWRDAPMRSRFMLALEQPGVRELVVVGSLGLAMHAAAHPAVAIIGTWTVLSLPLFAWFYPQSLSLQVGQATTVCLAPGFAIGTALLLRRIWHQQGPTASELPPWLAWLVMLIACAIGATGVVAEWRTAFLEASDFATGRSALFFFTITVPTCAAAAAIVRPRFLRALPLGIAASALLLGGLGDAKAYVLPRTQWSARWAAVAATATTYEDPRVAILRPSRSHGSLVPRKVQRHLATISPKTIERLSVRLVSSPKFVGPQELLIIDYGPVGAAMRNAHIKAPKHLGHIANLSVNGQAIHAYAPKQTAMTP